MIIIDFMKNKEYPMTNCKFYKYGRVNIIYYLASWQRGIWES